MNKRLTDEEMEEMLTWLEYQDELSGLVSKLVSSEKAAWEEVERMKGQLQDADKFIRYTIKNLMNAKSHEDFIDFDEIIKQGTLLYQSIQRIQGESESNE